MTPSRQIYACVLRNYDKARFIVWLFIGAGMLFVLHRLGLLA